MLKIDLKKWRQDAGLTQQELANRAELSLPTIQKIEANDVSPNIETLERLARELGLRISIEQELNLNRLVLLGFPIAISKNTVKLELFPSKKLLLSELHCFSRYLLAHPEERLQEVFDSMILAIYEGYPSLYKKIKLKFSVIKKISGRHIKFKRMILANISNYL
jgi:transcriptional regulator with XRE-family HTH domain